MLNATISELVYGKAGYTAQAQLANSERILRDFAHTLKTVDRSRFRAMAKAMPTRPPRPLDEYDQGGTATATVETDDDYYSAAELAQRHREREERYLGTVAHECRHATCGLFFGARVEFIKASAIDGGGATQFAGLPEERDVEISAAGSVWQEGTAWGQTARSDLRFIDKAIAKENPAARPGTDLWHQRLELAQARVNDVIDEHRDFYVALKSLLAERGRLDGSEVHRLWDRLRNREA